MYEKKCTLRRPFPTDLVSFPREANSPNIICNCDNPVLIQPASKRRAVKVDCLAFLANSPYKICDLINAGKVLHSRIYTFNFYKKILLRSSIQR